MMKKTSFLIAFVFCLVSCQTKPVLSPEPVSVADTIKTNADTVVTDTVIPEQPKVPMYDTEIFNYDTAYYVDPNNSQHKFVKYKLTLAMPCKNDSDWLVSAIRYDIMNFATESPVSNPTVASAGHFAKVSTKFKTEFRAANEFSQKHHFDWTIARFTKNAYQDSRLYCFAKGLYDNKGGYPTYGLSYSNWDKKGKEKVEYDDLFFDKDAENIRSVIVECMVKNYGVADEASLETKGISTEQIAPSSKFLLTKDSIYFVYSPYELGVDAERSIKIPVANKQLRQFMDTTKSIVRYLLNN